MEISFDDEHELGDNSHRSRGQVDRLLACYQKALGHELPNQLVALQGLARILESDLAHRIDDESRTQLQRLADLARRIDECIRTLAQIGRWCRDPGPVASARLAELVPEVVAEVNLLSPGWTVQYDGLQDLPPLTAPRVALYQVLVQLLRNAVRSPARGRPLHVTVGARIAESGAEVWVADNGVGIPNERQADLAEPFAGDRSAGGLGLGLFLVRQLVAGWAGRLRVLSEPGHGTTVTFLVPLLATRRSGVP